ncbi:MAG TPA: hypothetical protein VLA96_11100 [Terriglobales bacterium]|nr:hypothetical protein [Terriglobales bacterium]
MSEERPHFKCPLGMTPGRITIPEFEQQVLADLTELKTQMKLLLGNGQPGRVQLLESRVEHHEALVQRAVGVGALAGFLTTMLNLVLSYLQRR